MPYILVGSYPDSNGREPVDGFEGECLPALGYFSTLPPDLVDPQLVVLVVSTSHQLTCINKDYSLVRF